MNSLCSFLMILLVALPAPGNADPAQAGMDEIGFVQWFETPSGDLLVCESFGPAQKDGPAPRCAGYYAFADSGKEVALFSHVEMQIFPSEAQPPLISDGNDQVGCIVYRTNQASSPEDSLDGMVNYEFFFEVHRVSDGKSTQLLSTVLDIGDGVRWWPVYPVRHFRRFKIWVCLARGSERGISPETEQLNNKVLFVSDAGDIPFTSSFILPRNAVFVGSIADEEAGAFSLVFLDRGTPPWALNLDSDGRVYAVIFNLHNPNGCPIIQRITDVRGGEGSSCCVSPRGEFLCTLHGSTETSTLSACIWRLQNETILPIRKRTILPTVAWAPTSADVRWTVKWALCLDTPQLFVARDTLQELQLTVFDTTLSRLTARLMKKPLYGYLRPTFTGALSYNGDADSVVYSNPRQTHVFVHNSQTQQTRVAHVLRYACP